MAVVVAIIVLVVLAGIVLVGASRRRDRGAAGLSREARRRDRANPALAGTDETAAPTGREVEAAAVVDERDVSRARYHKENYGRDWNDPVHYHLVLNPELLGTDGAADLVVARAKALGWEASRGSEGEA